MDLSAQNILHSIEQGWLAPIFRIAALVAIVIALCAIYFFLQFAGLRHPDAMDQAQIARSIAAGNGFSTKYIRPLALWHLERFGKTLPQGNFPDFSHQPLVPYINSLFLALAKNHWKMNPLDIVYVGDRLIILSSMLFFLLSLVVFYFLGRLLFDAKLAALGTAAIVLTDLYWQFSLSGLPHMVVLFFFSLACLFTVLALQHHDEKPALLWLFLPLAALALGLATLAHGLAAWIFLGWLIGVGFYFRQHLLPIFVSLLLFLLVQTPWLLRNYQVCGNPFGLAIFTALDPGQEPEIKLLREFGLDVKAGARGLRPKIQAGIIQQASKLFPFLGLNIAALFFFAALLHRFRFPTAERFRWILLAMWLALFLGIAIFGVRDDPVSSNQLHVLFIAPFVFFGTAFLIVLWNRLEIDSLLYDFLFRAAILFLVALPMLFTLLLLKPPRIHWPPYIPPFIAVLNNWYKEYEILCSDMPWAVAWYADRKTILLPDTPRTLARINDYRVLGEPVTGLYLTPLTGNQPLVSSIYKGAYQSWARLITRPPDTQGFFLKSFTPLPIEGECIIFADTERWLRRSTP